MVKVLLYSKRKPTGFYAEIDYRDAKRVSRYRWSIFYPNGSKTAYARSGIKGKTVYLHRFIMEAETGEEIDHIDGNGLNNKRCNLRFVTHAENLRSAARLPGRYGNPTIEELDRELAEFEAQEEL